MADVQIETVVDIVKDTNIVYKTRVLTKEQRFNVDFLEAGEYALNCTAPFQVLPYWIGLAGEIPLETAVDRWELAHEREFPAEDPPEITESLRVIWVKMSLFIIETHAMAFRCWLKRRLVEDIEHGIFDFLTGEGWVDHHSAIYFEKAENYVREREIRAFCSDGTFGRYFALIKEAYDLHSVHKDIFI